MIVAIVTFKLPAPLSLAQATEAFKSTAPSYLGMPGLIRKHYYRSENGDHTGGIYYWKTRADAEACYTPEWAAMVTAKYGTPPNVVYGEIPVTVDNLSKVIETP